MSRLLLLFICLTWMAGVAEPSVRHTAGDARSIGQFLAALPLVVLLAATWSRLIARRVAGHNAGRCARRLGWVMIACRLFVVGWFAAGVFSLGWPHFVLNTLGAGRVESLRLPGLVVGTLPVLLAWVGLWWAQFPADQALRLQGQMDNLADELPVHRPPGKWAWLASNVRLQVLFTVMPVMLIVAVQDATSVALRPVFDWKFGVAEGAAEPASVTALRGQVEAVLWLVAAGVVFLVAPEVLRRILQTSPLADSPLRRRLEALSRRSGIRCRDILVWRTHFNVGNAAVMGLLPRVRYVLLSDLLLERLSDEEIEAVFAHEVGHVVHRHMAWYVVFFLILMLLAVGPGTVVADALKQTAVAEQYQPVLLLALSAGAIWLVFGFLSRRFERQADVYAARVMEAVRPTAGAAAAGAAALAPMLAGGPEALVKPDRVPAPTEGHVGTYGAQLFASALHRVATINHMPVAPRSRDRGGVAGHVSYAIGSLVDLAHDWLHGSIAGRMDYLRSLSADPALTGRFDRVMSRLYGALLFVLVASAAYALPMMMR